MGTSDRAALCDRDAVVEAVRAQETRATRGLDDMATYLAQQVSDTMHREVVGPLLEASTCNGLVLVQGRRVAAWGRTDLPEMLFSGTKSFVSIVAGVAFGDGLLAPDQRVVDSVDLSAWVSMDERVTWRHLLHQTSGWHGSLWGKPTSADLQDPTDDCSPAAPGATWSYNDVRVNMLCLALTVLWGRSLADVLGERVLGPLGCDTWSWHGYRDAVVRLAGRDVPVVSGGAHWGGGLWISSQELAEVGQLLLQRGSWNGRQLVSAEWIDTSWAPCPRRSSYGFLWWLNDGGDVLAGAPATGRCARGNLGRHLLWVDPARQLTIVSRWGDGVERLVQDVSAAVGVRG